MIWFTADTHFGHEAVISKMGRPFIGIKEHDDFIISGINQAVQKRDVLYILGDFAWTRPGHYRQRINCREVHLIWGNHDKESFKIHFSNCYVTRYLKESNLFLSHYPHAYWHKSHKGSMHLYGHCHGQREQTLDAAFPGRRSLDVGICQHNYCPLSLIEITNRLMARSGELCLY